jgi:signal transduction histidine kinase
LDSHACRLRHKLSRFGDRFVVNVWGVGYRLVDGPPAAFGVVEHAPPLAPAAAVAAPLALIGPSGIGWLLALAALALAVALELELRRRRELVARACHEVRGPLTAAHLALHAGVRHGDAPPARLAAVERELDRAARALDDLAATRRGRREADRDEPVDVGELLAAFAITWRAVGAACGSRVELVDPGPGAVVRGDRVRLGQAVDNLVANSLEHGHGRVEVLARAHGDRVRIEVADDGPGLPAPVADLTRRPRAGRGRRGRGLAIAADIADRHGGRLLAAPSARGARLALELPAWRGTSRGR